MSPHRHPQPRPLTARQRQALRDALAQSVTVVVRLTPSEERRMLEGWAEA